MKTHLLLMMFMAISLQLSAQATKDSTEIAKNVAAARFDYDRFIGKVLNLQTNTAQSSFIFDVSNTPTLQLTLPVFQGIYNQLFITGNVTSTNSYTPIIKKDKWAPDATISATYSLIFAEIVRFYVDEFERFTDDKGVTDYGALQQAINNASINDASQIFFAWLNFNGGYNYSSYNLFSEADGITIDKRIYKESYSSGVFRANLNAYFFPSKNYFPWLTFTGNIGINHKTNDTNYSNLTKVNVKPTRIYTDASGATIEVTEEEQSARKGQLVVENSTNLDGNIMALISPKENFYVGFSAFTNRRITENSKATNIGFGITLPIQKAKDKEKTIASFTLKYEIPDVNNEISTITMKDKAKLGFTIGVPINTYRPK